MEIIIKIQINGENVHVTTETAEKEERVKREKIDCSDYARIFDDGCVGWTRDPEFNLVFLRDIQNHCNAQLKNQGHLFLNEVYDMLGIPRTKAGAVVGWIYDEEHPHGDNFVDFGLYTCENNDFINGYKRTVLLDFNVDGYILDRI